MNRRAQVASLFVLAIGLIFSALYQQRFKAASSGGEKIKVLMVLKLIEKDKVITEEMLGTRDVPQAYVEDRAIKDVERGKLLGLTTLHAVQANETLMWTDVDVTDQDAVDLSSLVAPGNRAVCVRTARKDASNVLIRPGDYVDIIGVLSQPEGEKKDVGGMMRVMTSSGFEGPVAAVVLLQRVLVLASGLDITRDSVTASRPGAMTNSLLTLSITIPEAQLISLATEKGRITVALRNVEDQRTADRIPDLSSNSLLNSKEREEIKGRRAGSLGAGAPR
jgi:pilus assembly protein CpaB